MAVFAKCARKSVSFELVSPDYHVELVFVGQLDRGKSTIQIRELKLFRYFIHFFVAQIPVC